MFQSQLTMPVLLVFAAAFACSDSCADDVVHDSLKDAQTKYDSAITRYHKEVNLWFEKEEKAARKSGSEIAEKIQAIAAARKEFHEKGTLPEHVPSSLMRRREAAQKQLVRAMDDASDEYSRRGLDEKAAEILKKKKELVARIGTLSIHSTMLRATTWDMYYRHDDGVDHFIHRIVLASDGTIQGSINPNESTWEVRSEKLIFRHASGQITTVFHRMDKSGDRPIVVGIFTLKPGVMHRLTQVLTK